MNYKKIAEHYDQALLKHKGDKDLEVDWSTNTEANKRRYSAFANFVLQNTDFQDTTLDFGCGTGTMLDYMCYSETEYYTGIDISSAMIKEAQSRRPTNTFICQDILETHIKEMFDVSLANGTFTEKRDLHWTEMVSFVSNCLRELWEHTSIGLAFNLMNPHKIPKEDQRAELFFVSFNSAYEHFISPLKPSGYEIDSSYGCSDYLIKVYR